MINLKHKGNLEINGNIEVSGVLSIGILGTGTSINNLGIDSSGNVVTGTTGGSNTFTTGATLNGTILEFDRNDISNAYSVDLGVLTSPSYWTSGSSGSFSIRADNDSLGIDATGDYSVAEGMSTLALGEASHSEGSSTTASGLTSHAEGLFTIAIGGVSHTEGIATTAIGNASHAQGNFTIASGNASHAQGNYTTAIGNHSHTEGDTTQAIGDQSHAGGYNSIASGETSFIHSKNSLVTGSRSVVLGGQNITGVTADTVYVPHLNIKNVGSGTSIINLGIDSNGSVVTGTTGGGGSVSKYATDFTFTAYTASTITHNLGSTDVMVQMKDSTGSMIIPDTINNYQTNSVDIMVTIADTYRIIIIG